MAGKSVFLLGAGFIGGEILGLLLKEKYDVTTLTRREAAAADLRHLGANVAIGSLDDAAIIEEQVAQADIVLHTASADHLPSAQAILAGIEKRAGAGKQTIYIHTSGASLLADDSAGNRVNDFVFDDADPSGIDGLPDTAPHRQIDLAIVRKREALGSKAKIALMIPPVIYGVGSDGARLSIQYPTMVRYAIKHGYAGHVGAGLSLWNQVHVRDLARGYMTVLHHLEESEKPPSNPYWFCNNGEEISWGQAAAQIGETLHKAGRISETKTQTIPKENYDDLFAGFSAVVVGSNSRNRASRLAKLGWKAVEKTSLESLVDEEIPLILKEKGDFKGYAAPVAS